MNWLLGSRYYYGDHGSDDDEEHEKRAPSLANASSSSASDNQPENKQEQSNLNQMLNDAAAFVARIRDEQEDMETEQAAQTIQGMCVECTDQPAVRFCEQCQDDFCDVCFQAQHKRGMRNKHTSKRINLASNAAENKAMDVDAPSSSSSSAAQPMPLDNEPMPPSSSSSSSSSSVATPAAGIADDNDNSKEDEAFRSESTPLTNKTVQDAAWFIERARYIPLRLTLQERKFLRLLEATMNVSEYTDKVDIISYKDKKKRIYEQLKDVCAILSGLVVASDYQLGQKMIKDNNFKDNSEFFRDMFELGRRHKIRNPEKMRSAYGKLVYLLQDSVIPEIQELLEFNCVRKVRTVYEYLHDREALAMLKDARMTVATGEIPSDGRPRYEIDRDLKAKERAVNELCAQYASARITSDELRMCIGSIGDNHNFLRMNRDSCDKMIHYLQYYFKPKSFEPGFSLSIVGGRSGARLTHSHETQYYYCLQSMLLWREIMHDMFKLWCLAEDDLLDEDNPYRLRDTGQGLNRVQSAPRVGKALSSILHHVQAKVGFWVGSSVVHLGDHNVPNALMFIDKYNQVSRILNPIVITLRSIDRLCEKPDLKQYIDQSFGGPDRLRMEILCDFFRHAFDGSGADNFFDAGSCIDGRLTSAWNWCSKLEKKPFYPIFQLSGFNGFDGDFNG